MQQAMPVENGIKINSNPVTDKVTENEVLEKTTETTTAFDIVDNLFFSCVPFSIAKFHV